MIGTVIPTVEGVQNGYITRLNPFETRQIVRGSAGLSVI